MYFTVNDVGYPSCKPRPSVRPCGVDAAPAAGNGAASDASGCLREGASSSVELVEGATGISRLSDGSCVGTCAGSDNDEMPMRSAAANMRPRYHEGDRGAFPWAHGGSSLGG